MNTIKYLTICVFISLTTVLQAQDLGLDLKPSNTEELVVEQAYTAFIDLLESGDQFTIDLQSIGCFGGTKKSITVSRLDDMYTIETEGQEVTLAKDGLEVFRNFEQKLRKIGKGYCTSSDTYVISYKDQIYRKADATCSWNGFMRLKSELGLTEQTK